MANFIPQQPDHEGLQPAYNLRAGNGLEAPQVAYDRTEFKELNVPYIEQRSSRTALNMGSESPGSYGVSSFHSISSIYSTKGLRPDSDPRSNGYCGEKQPGWGLRPWWKRRWVMACFALAFLIVVAAAITIPLLILRNENASKQAISDAGASGSAPLPVSTSGAFAGTGIGANDFGDPTIAYFQHFDGDLWETASSGQDVVGKILDANSVRKGTPIAAIRYSKDNDTQQLYRHVVYTDAQNTLHDIIQQEGTGNWHAGMLGGAGIRVSSSPTVGLAFIGLQTDDTSLPDYPLGSLRVYYGGEDGKIHELTQVGTNSQWAETYVFPDNMNGNAGVYAGQPFTLTTLVCTTTSGELAFFNQNARAVLEGPWVQGPASGVTAAKGSDISMSLDYVAYYQDTNNNINAIGLNPNFTTAPGWGAIHTIDKAIPNTRLVGMSVAFDTTPAVIYQNASNTLTQARGTPVHGISQWAPTALPVDL